MFGHAPRNLLLVTCVLLGAGSTPSLGQMHARGYDASVEPGNVSCSPQGCPPRYLTYGYHHENWRRWPEEGLIEPGTVDLNPFVVPNRSHVPNSLVPDARDETGQVNRRRETAAPAATKPSTPTPPPAVVEPPTERIPATLPETAPQGEITPEANLFDVPKQDPGAILPTIPSDSMPAVEPLPSVPAEEADPLESLDALPGGDDTFDLDSLDFGELNPPQPAHEVRPVSHQAADPVYNGSSDRQNPLRGRIRATYTTYPQEQFQPVRQAVAVTPHGPPRQAPKTQPTVARRPIELTDEVRQRANPLRTR